MKIFLVIVRTGSLPASLSIPAMSTAHAAEQAAELYADEPCGITVTSQG